MRKHLIALLLTVGTARQNMAQTATFKGQVIDDNVAIGAAYWKLLAERYLV